MQARSQATQVKIDPSNCTPQQLAAYQKAQGDVTTALGKLLAITENYPDLKANQNFLELQSQLREHREPHQRGSQGLQRHSEEVQHIAAPLPTQHHRFDVRLREAQLLRG